MKELRLLSPSAWGMIIGLVCAMIAFPIGVGYLVGAGWGWLLFGVIMLSFAKISRETYHEERQSQET